MFCDNRYRRWVREEPDKEWTEFMKVVDMRNVKCNLCTYLARSRDERKSIADDKAEDTKVKTSTAGSTTRAETTSSTDNNDKVKTDTTGSTDNSGTAKNDTRGSTTYAPSAGSASAASSGTPATEKAGEVPASTPSDATKATQGDAAATIATDDATKATSGDAAATATSSAVDMKSVSVRGWSVETVATWVEGMGFDPCRFREMLVDGRLLVELDDDMLR